MSGFLHELVGSMSQGAAGNPTVVMMEATFAHHGLPWRYVNLEVDPDDLASAIRGAVAMGFRGFNLSVPHKVAVIEHLDGLGRSAEVIGAVNCVVRDGSRLIGENTDGHGFVVSLQEVVDPVGEWVVVLGAGGAARAIAVESALAGAGRITIVNRSADRGRQLSDVIEGRCGVASDFVEWTGDYVVPGDVGILVNATSIGLYDPTTSPPVTASSMHSGLVVADVVFNPVRTMLLRTAAARGCTTLDGLGMLVNQAAAAIWNWTGVAPDRVVMRDALERAMATG